MAAIITDKIRILNANNFIAGVNSTSNSYYSFIGLPNPTQQQSDWDTSPPSPKDSFDQENSYWDTMIALKKINSSDVRQVVQKRLWTSGTTYDMYRGDYTRSNTANVSGATNLYSASYYVLNSDYRVVVLKPSFSWSNGSSGSCCSGSTKRVGDTIIGRHDVSYLLVKFARICKKR